jgi:hypothetical protein
LTLSFGNIIVFVPRHYLFRQVKDIHILKKQSGLFLIRKHISTSYNHTCKPQSFGVAETIPVVSHILAEYES